MPHRRYSSSRCFTRMARLERHFGITTSSRITASISRTGRPCTEGQTSLDYVCCDGGMPHFKGIADFVLFFETIKERNRYVQDKSVSEFLDTVAETAQRRTLIMRTGTDLWRAQKSDEWETIYLPFDPPGSNEYADDAAD